MGTWSAFVYSKAFLTPEPYIAHIVYTELLLSASAQALLSLLYTFSPDCLLKTLQHIPQATSDVGSGGSSISLGQWQW